MNRPSSESIQSSRAEQRRLKLQEIEREQQAEEMEALKITEEQLRLLRAPFLSVKFEFSDLDGLHWTQSSLYSRQHRSPVAWHNDTSFTSPSPVAITRADLARLSPEETIRLPRKQAYPSVPKFGGTATSLGLTPSYRQKERSPVKGLFQDLDLNAAREYTVLSNYSPDIPYEDVLQDNAAYYNMQVLNYLVSGASLIFPLFQKLSPIALPNPHKILPLHTIVLLDSFAFVHSPTAFDNYLKLTTLTTCIFPL